MNILIGCDPELFIRDSVSGNFVSAAGLFPGTKLNPHKVKDGAIQVDGLALEFNINPATSEDEFLSSVKSVLSQMKSMVSGVNPAWELTPVAVANFSESIWGEVSQNAKVLGCDPDFNYRGEANPNPSEYFTDKPLRTGAGHIHIGWTENADTSSAAHLSDCQEVSRRFYQSGIFAAKDEEEKEREKYYGMDGSFRPKKYGIELRQASNHWLRSDESIRRVYRDTLSLFQHIAGVSNEVEQDQIAA